LKKTCYFTLQVVHPMMPQQQVADDQEQLGKNAKRPAQGGVKKGSVSKKVKPKNRGINAAASTERFPTSNMRAANVGDGSSNQCENHAVQPGSGRGRGKRGRGYAGGRRGGKWSADPVGAEGAANPPGFQGKPRRNAQKQKWEGKLLEGQTDLGKKMYSISWLLQRRGKETVQDSICDLPDFLHKHSLPPASQKRRYPYVSSPSHPSAEQQEVAQERPGDGSNFSEQTKKEEKDYTLSQKQQRIFHPQEETRNPNHQKNVFTSRRNGNKEPGEQPAHPDNLFAPTTTKPSSTGLMAAVAEAMHVQSVHSHASPKPDPKNRLHRKEEYLYNRLVKTKAALPSAPASRHQLPESSPPDVHRQGKNVPRDYDFKHESGNEVSRAYPGMPREFSPKSLADTYPENPPPSSHQKLPNSEPVRFSISSLKESERQQVALMLHEKLQKYSVPPGKLAYASKSASKLVKNELKSLGYIEVPTPNLNDVTLTKEEKTRLSFQHEIRKHYRSAIFKANEEVSKVREYIMKTLKKNPRYGGGQYF